jgi:serine/threonine protein kinase
MVYLFFLKVDIFSSCDGLNTLTGTPNYMAPEGKFQYSVKLVVIMESGHGRPADIWSFACTMLEMFTGKPPFSEFSTPASVMFHIASSTCSPQFPDFLSQEVKNFLSKCFTRNPKLRPNVTELLNDVWFTEGDLLVSNEICIPVSPPTNSPNLFKTNEEYVEHNRNILKVGNLKEKFKNDPKKDLQLM